MSGRGELLYVADPMCSWCWGFAPVMEAVRRRLRPGLPLRLVAGGLRPGPAARPLDAAFRAALRRHWEAVQARTGQPFAWALLERDGFVYDTLPACRAMVAVRRLAPERTLPFFQSLQRAFYGRGEDITAGEVLAALASGQGVEGFPAALAEPATEEETWADFRLARELGVAGFPTLLLRSGPAVRVLSQGYRPWERLEPLLSGCLIGTPGR